LRDAGKELTGSDAASMETVQVGVVDDLEELIRADLLGRLPPVPRRVHMAPELTRSSAYAAHRHVVDEIAAQIAMGYDITPHLSRARPGFSGRRPISAGRLALADLVGRRAPPRKPAHGGVVDRATG
jgi:hypothetical protein